MVGKHHVSAGKQTRVLSKRTFKVHGGNCLNRTGLAACGGVWVLFILLFCPAWATIGVKCQVSSSSSFLSGLLWPSVMTSLFYVLSSDSFTHGLMGSHPSIPQVLTVGFADIIQVRDWGVQQE